MDSRKPIKTYKLRVFEMKRYLDSISKLFSKTHTKYQRCLLSNNKLLAWWLTMEPKMKLKHIDSLRGIAILLVILVHTSQGMGGISSPLGFFVEYGQMGVQLFFVISAYTLCLSMDRRREERYPIAGFFIRRFFRIAPLYYLGVLFYLIWYGIEMTDLGFLTPSKNYSFVNITANLFFIHSFHPETINSVVPGGWSVGTEMAFYVCFPLLYWLTRKVKNNYFLLLLLPLGALAVNLVVQTVMQWEVGNSSFIYFNLINQMPAFLVGIALFWLEKSGALQRLNWKADLLGLGFFSLASMILWKLNLPYAFSLTPLMSGMSFIFLYDLFAKNTRLNASFLVKMGRVSFSAYLFHFIFSWRGSEFLAALLHETAPDFLILAICLTLTVGSTYAIATFTEKLIEKRGISWGKKLIQWIEARPRQADQVND
jgi:peptidoglycan/LPS O-acetylase OafA/YrhL